MNRAACRRLAVFGFAAALPCAAAAPAAAQPVTLSDHVTLTGVYGATDAVREQCGLQTLIPELVAAAGPDVRLVEGRAKGGRVLELRVAEVHAPGGGPFAGPKWLVVNAELHEGGRVVASARAKRVTAAPFGGTCDQLQKVTRAIAVDLGAWLRDPRGAAELGDR
jgi:hypothetical protein